MKVISRTVLIVTLFLIVWINTAVAAFLKDGNTISVISYPGVSYNDTYAYGINDSGQIVGDYYDGTAVHGFMMDGGKFTSIDYAYAGVISTTRVRGINDSGQIVGGCSDGFVSHGFMMDGGKFTSIDYPGAFSTNVSGINDSGLIVGEYWDGSRYNGFTANGDTFTSFNYPGSSWNHIVGVNDLGQILGAYYDEFGYHNFIKDDDIFTSFDLPDGYNLTGINDAGLIVGYIGNGNNAHGLIKDGDTLTSFDFLGADWMTYKDWRTYAYDINNAGQIVGYYYFVSEPTTILLFGCGLVGLFAGRRMFIRQDS